MTRSVEITLDILRDLGWFHDTTFEQRDELRATLEKYAPAVPQPVDREALAQMAAEWRQSADEDERYLNRAHASEIHDVYASIRINREHADAVLALLAGEQEQVEK